MEWDRLLNPNRLGKERTDRRASTRTVFERDRDYSE